MCKSKRSVAMHTGGVAENGDNEIGDQRESNTRFSELFFELFLR